MASQAITSQHSDEVKYNKTINPMWYVAFPIIQEKSHENETLTSSLDSYQVVKIIGHSFDAGRVLLATTKECSISAQSGLVAVKQYSLENCQQDLGLFLKVICVIGADWKYCFTWFSILLQEVWLMRHLKHSNIITCIESFVLHHSLHIVTPLCNYGSALDLIQSHFYNGFPEPVIAGILRDVLQASQFCHYHS